MRILRRVLFLLLILFVLGLFAQDLRGQGVGFRRAEYVTGAGPEAVAVADFNGDGKLDLAVANRGDNTVSILLGNGDGTFGAKTDFGTGGGPVGILADDFNGDGKMDLATVNNTDSKVSVLLGNGDGTFGTKTDFATGTDPAGITSGDFNGDGKPDLVTANATGNDISILLGQGGGSFGVSVNFATSTRPIRVVVGDFNGDGKLDVAALAYVSNVVSLLLGNGDGTFRAKTDFATGSTPWSLAKSDFDGDAKLDLVTANLNDWTASILRGKGDGTFDPKTDLGTDTQPIAVTAADFNADGKNDFLTANLGYYYWYYGYTYGTPAKATLRLGNGDGTFGNLFSFGLVSDPSSIAIGDFNADGRIDVVMTSPGDDTVSVLLQSSAVSSTPCCSLDFGSIAQGSTSANQDVLVDSTGSFPVNFSSASLSGADAAEFNISSDTCSNKVVNPLSHCTVSVTFAPTSPGSKAATLSITHDAPTSPTTLALSGNGLAPVPLPVFAPSSIDFGTLTVGQTNGSSVTLTNNGSVTLNITSITLTGADAGEFQQSNNCGATLASTAVCSIAVTFAPTSAGAKSAAVSVVTNAAGSPHAVPLTGTGVLVPLVSLSRTAVTFNPQVINTPSAAEGVTLTNTGTASLTISSISVGGSDAAEFNLTKNCGTSLAAGANCSFSVVFTPVSAGARVASVSIVTDAASSPDKVALTGTGITPAAISIAPTSLTFNSQLVGSTSTAQTVTLTNTGGAALSITSMALGGANAADFTRSDNCGTSVNGGANCTITLAFKPTAAGNRGATLSISTNASGSPHSVSLAGDATDFNIGAASGGSTTTTVSPGGSGSFTLSLTPTNSYTGNVALSCSTSSAEVSCAVPASAVMNGSSPTNVTVTVTTTSRAWAPIRRLPRETPPSDGLRIAATWMALLLLLGSMLRWGVARRGPVQARWRPAVALAAIILCAQLWMGCGGSAGSTPRPPRAYAITVNASAAGVVRTIGLTVIVP